MEECRASASAAAANSCPRSFCVRSTSPCSQATARYSAIRRIVGAGVQPSPTSSRNAAGGAQWKSSQTRQTAHSSGAGVPSRRIRAP